MYKFLLNVLLLLVLFQLPLTAQQRMIFLFDNSGSMTGYYLQPESNFKIFCNALIKNTVSQVDNVEVMLFSKTEKDRGLISPTVIYDGSADQINFDELQMKMVLQKGNDGYLGNTDLIEALNDGITELDGNAGIIWMITDNINDVSGTGDDSYENTLEFYNLLRRDENIRKILMYPIPEKVTRNEKVSEGYVIYGLVYSSTPISQPLLEDYDKMLRASGIRQKAITLKPLDQGTIILKPLKTQGKVTSGKLYFDGKTLRGFGFNEGEQIKEVFNDLVLKSNLYPYIIESASLKVGLDDFTSSDYSVESLGTQTITPSTVSNVSPEGEVKGFSVIFNMPEITPVFSFNTIFKEDFTVGGNLILEVYNTDIKLDDSYIQKRGGTGHPAGPRAVRRSVRPRGDSPRASRDGARRERLRLAGLAPCEHEPVGAAARRTPAPEGEHEHQRLPGVHPEDVQGDEDPRTHRGRHGFGHVRERCVRSAVGQRAVEPRLSGHQGRRLRGRRARVAGDHGPV